MDKQIIFYTDGSYKNKKCGYAFLFHFQHDKTLPTICYGVYHGKNSTSAEISAIIKAIEYIKYLKLKGFLIEIRTDLLILANNLSRKMYIQWDKCLWKKENGRKVISNTSEWFMLCSLLKSDTDNSFIFSKVKSKKDSLSRKIDFYSKVGRNLNINKTGFLYVVKLSANNYMTSRLDLSNFTYSMNDITNSPL